MSVPKGVPLTKDEVKLLIQLVAGQPIIISKATNSTNNKLKDDAWRRLTEEFNAAVSTGRRKPEQLRLKWENLKKAARKRETSVRANIIKTGGGKPDFIPPDDNLEHVASILGSTCKGLPVVFGGDAEDDILIAETGQPSSSLMGDTNSIADLEGTTEDTTDNLNIGGGDTDMVVDGAQDFTPRGYRFMSGPKRSAEKLRQRKTKDDESLDKRNIAIAEYYIVKKRKVELDIEEKLLNQEKLKLELENLKIENEKLKKELEQLK